MTCSNRRCNLIHLGSAGALSDFQQLNGPQCSVGFKGFVWVSDSRRATFCVSDVPAHHYRVVVTLPEHPPTPISASNGFCSCTRLLSMIAHTEKRKLSWGENHYFKSTKKGSFKMRTNAGSVAMLHSSKVIYRVTGRISMFSVWISAAFWMMLLIAVHAVQT